MKANVFSVLMTAGLVAVSCTAPREMNDIYLCGNDSERSAFYRVNGVKTPLSPDCYAAQVSAIEVSDGDIYCSGYIRERKEDNATAVYWKNGSVNRITDGSCSACVQDMYVTHNTVCCVGSEADGPERKVPRRWYGFDYDMIRHNRAKVWFARDGGSIEELALTDGEHHGSVESIYVDPENRMHLVGYDDGTRAGLIGTIDGFYQSRYWLLSDKDRTLVQDDPVFEHCSKATTVFGSGTDIYIGGWNDDDLQSSGGFDALYWKDGWAKDLPHNFEVVIVDGCTDGSDWYMCGYGYRYNDVPYACYYKNGQAVKLAEPDSPVQSKIHSMAIVGEDVYMAGCNGMQAGYWKNEAFMPLDGICGDIVGIVVREPDIKRQE